MKTIKIIEYDAKYSTRIYDFIVQIRLNELGWKSEPDDLKKIPEIYMAKNGSFWIALIDDRVVGTIALEDLENNQGYLQRMYLDEKYRGTGLADKLLNTLLSFAKRKNYKEIFLGTTTEAQRAIRFYEKNNFKRIPCLPFEEDKDDVFFKMEL